MKKVNVYVYSTIKGPCKQKGAYIYILETNTAKGPATVSNQKGLENVTEHQANLHSLTAALKRLSKPSYLVIYTDSVYLASGLEKWMNNWSRNNWKTAKGKEVANAEEWKKLAILLNGYEYEVCVDKNHSYYEWMVTEAEKVTKGCTQ